VVDSTLLAGWTTRCNNPDVIKTRVLRATKIKYLRSVITEEKTLGRDTDSHARAEPMSYSPYALPVSPLALGWCIPRTFDVDWILALSTSYWTIIAAPENNKILQLCYITSEHVHAGRYRVAWLL
jgi:hypothetical protein